MKSLSRVFRAPALLVVVVLIQAIVASRLGTAVGAGVEASMGRYSLAPQRPVLGAVLELFSAHRGLATLQAQTVVWSALFAIIFWTLAAPAIILRLRSRRPLPRLAGDSVRALPGVVATTAWHLLLRGVLVGIFGAAAAMLMNVGVWGLVATIGLALVVGLSSCALDLARCEVVLQGDRGFRPGAALRGYVAAIKRPAVLGRSLVASFAQWACLVVILVVAGGAVDGQGAMWLIRLLGMVATVCALIRVAVAVEATLRY